MISTMPGGRFANDVVALAADTPTVWISRDADVNGLDCEGVCDLWIKTPPVKRRDGKAVSWVCASDADYDDCYLGPYTLAAVAKFFRTAPDDANQLIRVER